MVTSLVVPCFQTNAIIIEEGLKSYVLELLALSNDDASSLTSPFAIGYNWHQLKC